MINFAELKLKLCELFFKKLSAEATLYAQNENDKRGYIKGFSAETRDAFLKGVEHQHTKDAKIISQLLEIIEMQDKHICTLHNYIQHNEDNLVGDDLKGDGRFTERFKRYIKSTNDCLSETESKLKQLIKGV